MSYILFDNDNRKSLYPLTKTRAVADIRVGILTLHERWEILLQQKVFVVTTNYLQPLYESVETGLHTWIDASVIPNDELVEKIFRLPEGEILQDEQGLLIATTNKPDATFSNNLKKTTVVRDIARLQYPWEIFLKWNDCLLRKDFALLTQGKISQPISSANHVTNPANIFIETGADVEHAYLNASAGPIYIGKEVQIMEGSMIRGPFAACEKSVVKMGTKIYGATTIGPHCTVGGELKNVVMQAYSNKAHDGYLGDAVIGTWCNMGAGTSNSNVKNTGSAVKVWHEHSAQEVEAGLKCGVIMGDYSRTSINTSFNTGTIAGVCCNIFGEGISSKTIPDFSWGNKGKILYKLEKALQDISNWKKMKQQQLSNTEIAVLKHIFGALKI